MPFIDIKILWQAFEQIFYAFAERKSNRELKIEIS